MDSIMIIIDFFKVTSKIQGISKKIDLFSIHFVKLNQEFT